LRRVAGCFAGLLQQQLVINGYKAILSFFFSNCQSRQFYDHAKYDNKRGPSYLEFHIKDITLILPRICSIIDMIFIRRNFSLNPLPQLGFARDCSEMLTCHIFALRYGEYNI